MAVLAAALLAGCSAATPAHTAKIVGNAMSDAGQPYAHIPIFLQPLGLGATTDDFGNFLFDSLPAGDYVLHFAPPNEVPFDKTVTVHDGQTVNEMFMRSG